LAVLGFTRVATTSVRAIAALREREDLLLPVPPALVGALERFPASVQLVLFAPRNDPGAGAEAVRRVTADYPTGLLYYLLGVVLANDGRLDAAEAALLAAAERPSLVP